MVMVSYDKDEIGKNWLKVQMKLDKMAGNEDKLGVKWIIKIKWGNIAENKDTIG